MPNFAYAKHWLFALAMFLPSSLLASSNTKQPAPITLTQLIDLCAQAMRETSSSTSLEEPQTTTLASMAASRADITYVKPAWQLPLSAGTHAWDMTTGVSVPHFETDFPKLPNVHYSEAANALSEVNKDAILEAFGRVALFFPSAIKFLPQDLYIELQDGDKGPAVNIAQVKFLIPRRWLLADCRSEIISDMSHEFGHPLYSYYVKAKFEEARLPGYAIDGNNAIYKMLEPIAEVFADLTNVIAVGRSDAVSMSMPVGSYDRLIRDFAFTGWNDLLQDDKFIRAKSQDEHIQSRLRSVVWSHMSDHFPIRNAFSVRLGAAQILDALTPIRWLGLIDMVPGRPPLFELVATLALEYVNETITEETLAPLLLNYLYSRPDRMLYHVRTGDEVVIELIAQSPALVAVLKSAGHIADFESAVEVLQRPDISRNYDISAIMVAFNKVDIEEEVAEARRTMTVARTRTIAGPTFSRIAALAVPSTTSVRQVPLSVQSMQSLEQTVEREIVRVGVRASSSEQNSQTRRVGQ